MFSGSAPATARRAARFGFGLFPPTADSELVDLYRSECERLGRKPADYLLESYRGLFVQHCEQRGMSDTDMLFDAD